MGKERILKITKKTRASGFIHIGEVIPGVLKDVEGRIRESHKDKKARLGSAIEEERT